MRDWLQDEFTNLMQGSFPFLECKTRLHKLVNHATVLMMIEHERVNRFIIGLAVPFQLATEQMVAPNCSFLQIFYHVCNV